MSPTSGVISEAWGLYKTHWRHLLGISFVVYAVVAIIGALLAAALTWVGAILGALVSLVALFWLQGALVKAVEDIRDGRADLSLGDTFAAARPHIAAVAVAGILAVLGIFVGLVLLIVPGLLLMTWWVLIIPVIVLEQRRASEAFTRSRELVRGYGWGVFGVIVLALLLLIGLSIVLNLILTPLADWLQGFVSDVVTGTLTAPFIALTWTLLYFRLRDVKAAAHSPGAPPGSA